MQQKPVIFLAFANEMESASRYLRGLAKEKMLIKEALESAAEAGLCELIVESNATVGSIINTFQKARYRDRIAIFHYGGHADGYQLLLEGIDGKNVVAHGEGLVSFFARQTSLQLIFLNGCSTQEQSLDLVSAGVPAVIGTSHAVSDEVATKLATRFYGGLASGASIQRSWKEAEDEVLILKGKGNTRSLYFQESQEAPEFFPWDLYIRDGAEVVKDWNLPEAVDNPLFGLPDPPLKHLPERPYRFLERYTEEHSEIFFGRSYYIRDLFDRVSNPNSAPVILLYGQSGVGKSSLLDAGLFPRLEQSCEVVYARRDRQKGLLGTLKQALDSFGIWELDAESANEKRRQKHLAKQKRNYQNRIEQIEFLARGLDEHSQAEIREVLMRVRQEAVPGEMNIPMEEAEREQAESLQLPLLEAWQLIEAQNHRPLVVILDQAEEAFSQPNPYQPNEWGDFLKEIKTLFLDPNDMPAGKLILSYRKEYHPEIEEFLKNLHIPREQIFLKQLNKKDLNEVISGLTTTERLRHQYRLTVEDELPSIIADDLLEDKDSPIAPVLQILLTKMWHQVKEEEYRNFSVQLYQSLRKDGILMGDFLDQQLENLEDVHPEWVLSGWALDLLYFHTTALGTAGSKTEEEILERYADKAEDLPILMRACKDLYLLAGGGGGSVLAHDTLAPLVQERFRTSDLPGQRAARLLENKIQEYENDPKTTLDGTDLAIVEAGQHGMKQWTADEVALVKASQKRRDRSRALRKNLLIVGAIGALLVLGFGIYARIERNRAIESRQVADVERNHALESKKVAEEKTVLAEEKEAEARKAREEAEKSAQDAIEQRKIAEAKEREARESEARVRLRETQLKSANDSLETARQNATQKTRIAEQAKIVADSAKKAAESRLYLSAAKALATKSLVADDSIKIILTSQACLFNDSLDGPEYDPDLYQAMYQSLKSRVGKNYQILPADPTSPSHQDAIRAIAFLDNRFLITAGAEGKLLRWDWDYNAQSESYATLKNGIPRGIAINPAGEILLISTEEAAAKQLASIKQPGSLKRFGLHAGKTFDVVPLKDGKGFVSVGEDRRLMWSDAAGSSRQLDSLSTKINALAAHPNGNWLVGAGEDGDLVKWEIHANYQKTTTNIAILNEGVPLESVAFSQDGKILVLGDAQGKIIGLDWATERILAQLKGHKSRVTDLAFRPDNRQLASSSWDGSVRLWNLDRINDLPIILDDHEDWVMSIAYSLDGSMILAGLRNGQLKYWFTKPDHMREALFDQLDRSMTPTEWKQYVGEEIPYKYRVKPKP
ncbi:MAG: AAA family ATPase [Bacteroidota bacterium]